MGGVILAKAGMHELALNGYAAAGYRLAPV